MCMYIISDALLSFNVFMFFVFILELHGRMISVEKAKSESESSSRRQPPARPERRPSKERKEEPHESEV